MKTKLQHWMRRNESAIETIGSIGAAILVILLFWMLMSIASAIQYPNGIPQ